MKNLKVALFALLVMGAAAVVAFTVPAKKAVKVFDGDITYGWTGAAHFPAIDFAIGTTSSTELNNTSNWNTSDPTCTGSGKVCKVRITYTGTPNPAITEQNVLDEVKAHYDASTTTPKSFSPNPWTKTINGVVVTFTITEKS